MLPFDPGKVPYVNLATFRKNGVEVRTPVWIAEHDGEYYVFSEGNAGKVKRIRANGKVRMAACDMRGNVKSDWIDGTARIVDDPDEVDSMYRAFSRKYTWQMWIANFFSRLSGRFARRAILAIKPGA